MSPVTECIDVIAHVILASLMTMTPGCDALLNYGETPLTMGNHWIFILLTRSLRHRSLMSTLQATSSFRSIYAHTSVRRTWLLSEMTSETNLTLCGLWSHADMPTRPWSLVGTLWPQFAHQWLPEIYAPVALVILKSETGLTSFLEMVKASTRLWNDSVELQRMQPDVYSWPLLQLHKDDMELSMTTLIRLMTRGTTLVLLSSRALVEAQAAAAPGSYA